MSEEEERRLAAILAGDVAGYSCLMGIDEEGTLAALKRHRRELVDLKIKEHRGRIVKVTGAFGRVVANDPAYAVFRREVKGALGAALDQLPAFDRHPLRCRHPGNLPERVAATRGIV
jgi:class 3 adenylate cyclase